MCTFHSSGRCTRSTRSSACVLDRRLPGLSDRRFHDEMLNVFIGLRECTPTTCAGAVRRQDRLRSRSGSRVPLREGTFGVTWSAASTGRGATVRPGVEVTHWNGIPIDRAVALNGERNSGSNADARHARGLASMTQRPMGRLAAPDEEWVTLTFLADGRPRPRSSGSPGTSSSPPPRPRSGSSALEDPATGALGLDAFAEEVRRAQKAVLVPDAMDLEQEMASGAEEKSAADLSTVSVLPDVFQFRAVQGPQGELGYLRIRTFMVEDPDKFIAEVVRILGLLPQNGLIIDVRGNGGGRSSAGRCCCSCSRRGGSSRSRCTSSTPRLTLAAPRSKASTVMASVDRRAGRDRRRPSRDGLPLASDYPRDATRSARVYHGPVVLITDALCYSHHRHLRRRLPGPRASAR